MSGMCAVQSTPPQPHRSVHFGLKMPLRPVAPLATLPCVLAATQQLLMPVQSLATFQSVVQPSSLLHLLKYFNILQH